MSSAKVLELISRFWSIHTRNIIKFHKRLLLIPRVVLIRVIPKELHGTKSLKPRIARFQENGQDPLLRMKYFTLWSSPIPSSSTTACMDRLSEKSQKTRNLYRDSTDRRNCIFFILNLYFYLFVIKLYFYLCLIRLWFYFLIKLYFYLFLIKLYFFCSWLNFILLKINFYYLDGGVYFLVFYRPLRWCESIGICEEVRSASRNARRRKYNVK